MSSPFQTLKKNKVPLFPGHMSGNRPIPFQHPEYSEGESKLLEEMTTSLIQERKKQTPFKGLPILQPTSNTLLQKKLNATSVNVSSQSKTDTRSPPSDFDLMQVMLTKIASLEKQKQTMETDLRTKDKQIQILTDKLRMLEGARKETVSDAALQNLETHCLLLQQQVHEMETFLAEYGLVWVGEYVNEQSDVYLEGTLDSAGSERYRNLTETSARGESSVTSVTSVGPPDFWQPNASLPGAPLPMKLNFNQLIENIRDLNILAGEGESYIKKTTDGARFEVPEPVQLTIYANGIMMFDGPFRPYTDPGTYRCIQDLMDGYFPSELQSRYPDGVPFALTDLRETYYEAKKTSTAFVGEGQMLGGEIKASRLIPTNLTPGSEVIQHLTQKATIAASMLDQSPALQTSRKPPGKPMTRDQFLKRLPKSIIKDGKVIDIRDSVSRTLAGNGLENGDSNVSLISSHVTQEVIVSRRAGDDTQELLTGSDVTTLRVVSHSGNEAYIVRMKFTETVGDLRTYLDSHRQPLAPYEIVSTFPHKVHRNNMLTLEESGLTPSAVLHLKLKV